jgi:hypothetical protein
MSKPRTMTLVSFQRNHIIRPSPAGKIDNQYIMVNEQSKIPELFTSTIFSYLKMVPLTLQTNIQNTLSTTEPCLVSVPSVPSVLHSTSLDMATNVIGWQCSCRNVTKTFLLPLYSAASSLVQNCTAGAESTLGKNERYHSTRPRALQ